MFQRVHRSGKFLAAMKTVAILQSNYIPWKGYFDIIRRADCFIFHDDLQYTKNDWRNRNKIKTAKGLTWLTIPCGTSEHRLICEVELKDSGWQKKHWRVIRDNYAKAPFFDRYAGFFEEFYCAKTWSYLSEMNHFLIRHIAAEFLDIRTPFEDSRSYDLKEKKGARVLELLGKAGASHYLSGPAAKSYIAEEDFQASGIEVQWMDYGGYPEYPQFFPPFEHGVSIIDLLFQTGPRAGEYLHPSSEAS